VIAAGWGFAEASLFFLVPDVWLSRVALDSPRRALRGCLWALAGALGGGALMWAWGGAAPATAEAALDSVPGISAAMVAGVRAELAGIGWSALFLGPATGTPYKIYAVEAGILGRGLLPLLAVSVPARLLRFVLVTLLAAGLARAPGLRRLPPRAQRWLHAAAWTAFYVLYLSWKGW
jgi:membrane protein YqaA with SNARE-associated domain